MKILIAILAGALILTVLQVLRIILRKTIRRNPSWARAGRLYPLLVGTSWIAYAFWLAGYLFRQVEFYPYLVTGMVFIIMGLVTWFYLRDLFAGIMFRLHYDLGPGDAVKAGDIPGQVEAMHLTCLEILTGDGHTVSIPYTRLNREPISKISSTEGMEESAIRLIIPRDWGKQETGEKISRALDLSPWINHRNPPVVRFTGEDENHYTCDVVVHTLNQKHFGIVENFLKQRFEQPGQ
jgi:hypothetical protein